MTYDPQIHHRRSIRLRGYDYSRAGLYFVTVCAHGKEDLFGQMVEGEMKPNDYGEAVRLFWNDLPRHYPHARLDSFVVMPNHAHGVIEIVGAGLKPALAARTIHGYRKSYAGSKHIHHAESMKCGAHPGDPYGSEIITSTSFGDSMN